MFVIFFFIIVKCATREDCSLVTNPILQRQWNNFVPDTHNSNLNRVHVLPSVFVIVLEFVIFFASGEDCRLHLVTSPIVQRQCNNIVPDTRYSNRVHILPNVY